MRYCGYSALCLSGKPRRERRWKPYWGDCRREWPKGFGVRWARGSPPRRAKPKRDRPDCGIAGRRRESTRWSLPFAPGSTPHPDDNGNLIVVPHRLGSRRHRPRHYAGPRLLLRTHGRSVRHDAGAGAGPQVPHRPRRERHRPFRARVAALQGEVKLATDNETFKSCREREHNDLVLAVALVCWYDHHRMNR